MSLRAFVARRDTGDRGVALVAAVAVAIIGIAITTIVVAQAVQVTRDSARDRIRTLEVHSAESALDSMMSQLATSAPCPSPAWSPKTYGSGSTVTKVTVTITYDVPCVSGTLSGTPTEAFVTAVSEPVMATGGQTPKRTFSAEVKLVPQTQSLPGAAVYSNTAITFGGGFTVLPADPSKPAAVWQDTGNYDCSVNGQVVGAIYVPAGSVSLKTGCSVTGDVWASTGFNNCCSWPTASGWQVGGNVTVRNGNFTLNGSTRIGGDIKVNGNVPVGTGHWNNSVKNGAVCANNLPTACTSFTDYSTIGMPLVPFDMSKWQPPTTTSTFALKHKSDLAAAILASWGNTYASNINNEPCTLKGWISTAPIKLPLNGTNTPTVYDLRDCKFNTAGDVTVALYSDVAIFAKEFSTGGKLTFTSGDNLNHKLWLIVPAGSGADGKGSMTITVNGVSQSYTAQNMDLDNNITINKSISTFFYTPKELHFHSTSETYGQLYGGKVTVGAGGGKFYYVAQGVPGVNLGIPTSTASGYRVEIVSKQEQHD